MELLAKLLEDSTSLNLEYVAKYDEGMMPKYPGVLIQPGEWTKEIHGTATFSHNPKAEIWVMHANLSAGRRTRSLEDCLLATRVIEVIEQDRTLGGKVIFGMVERERFAALPPRGAKNDGVVSTQLSWTGIVQSRFK